MFATARRLREAGVLGLNERNAEFIMRLNPRRLYPRVDDKAITKELAIANGMALHGGALPVVGTFLVFADYMRPAIRLAMDENKRPERFATVFAGWPLVGL